MQSTMYKMLLEYSNTHQDDYEQLTEEKLLQFKRAKEVLLYEHIHDNNMRICRTDNLMYF